MTVVLWECLVGLVPVTILTIVTLGAILAGLTTASEAAALGALGAIAARHPLRQVHAGAACSTPATARSPTTSMVLFLAVASNVFGAVFAWLGTATWITNALLAAPLPAWGTMTLLLTLIFLLGWPFEWPAIVLIFLPLLAPVAKGLGYDMVWFGCIVAVVLQTAFLSPPVAMSAYYLKQVVKEWNLRLIYRGMADFMVIQVHLRRAGADLPGDRHVVPELAAGPPGCGAQEGADRVCGAGGGHRFGGQGKLRETRETDVRRGRQPASVYQARIRHDRPPYTSRLRLS